MTLFALLFAATADASDRAEHARGDRSDADRAEHAEARHDRDRDGHVEATRTRHAHASRARHVAARHHRAHGHRHAVHRRPVVRTTVVHAAPPRTRHAAPARRVPAAPDNNVSVMVNALNVPAPLLSVSAEGALGRKVGLVGTGGLGFAQDVALYDVGADLRGYVIGDFDRGLFLSGGVGTTNFTPVSAGVSSLTIDGAVGAKFTFDFGLTLDGSIGVAAYTNEQLGVVSPTAKIGVGWSF